MAPGIRRGNHHSPRRFSGYFMTHHIDDVQINRVHSGAICKEIGDRLRISLAGEGDHLPPALRLLMEQLAKTEAAGRA
jgi:hypothetical protein